MSGDYDLREVVPIFTNVFNANVMDEVLKANTLLESNDEEGAKEVVRDMIRAGHLQMIVPDSVDLTKLL